MGELQGYKTFICYRRSEDPNSILQLSCAAADAVYRHINDTNASPEIRDLRKVVFEERIDEHMRFDKVGFEKYITQVNKFVIMICPDFFTDLLNKYNKLLIECARIEEEEDGQNKAATLKKQFFKGDDSINIAYQEIAFALSKKIDLYPIYVLEKLDSDGHIIQNDERKTVTDIFRKILEEKYTVDKTEANLLAKGLFSYVNIPQVIMEKNSEGVYDLCDPEKQKQIIAGYLCPIPVSSKDNLNKILLEHLKMIENMIYLNKHMLNIGDNEPDNGAYRRLHNRKPGMFCITNAYINGVESLKKSDDHGVGKGRGFKEIKNSCGNFPEEMDDDDITPPGYDYCCWPVEFKQNRINDNPDYISICAVCFGALLRQNWLDNDAENCGMEVDRKSEKEIKAEIYGALNLLLTLRDYEQMAWMSQWNFEIDKLGTITGTINQTTLSISTLLRCGFLACPDQEQLKNRLVFINNSIEWLRRKAHKEKVTRTTSKMYWCNPGDRVEGSINISLTLFSFDVFVKYYSYLRTLQKERFKNNPKIKKSIIDVVWNDISSILYALSVDPFVRILLEDNEKTAEQILKLSKLLKSLCGSLEILKLYKEETDKSDEVKTVSDMIKTILEILAKANENLLIRADRNSIMETFPYNDDINGVDPELGDKYENCIELLYVDSIFVALTIPEGEIDCDRSIKARLMNKALIVLNEYIKYYVKVESEGVISVCGHIEERENPIYAYYYYRMVIDDYLKLPDEWKNEVFEDVK